MSLTMKDHEELANAKASLLKDFFAMEPPKGTGEALLDLWAKIYDDTLKSTVVQTTSGPSDDQSNPVFPYEKLYAIVGDGGNWKWPRIWRCMDELERRGPAYREGDSVNLGLPNPNPHVVAQRVLVVGGGPVGLRLAIQLKLSGHQVTVFEKRREVRKEDGQLEVLGFTNRINRPHVFYFLRNDLERLNGRNWMTAKMCYPIFTQGDTASIGIDELQVLLLKNALLLGVDFRLGVLYEDAAQELDATTQKPRWRVKCNYDAPAAAACGVEPGSKSELFDVLVGADGARSRVRESQPQLFGEIDKRNFKKMIGVVGNVQKVSRRRLTELGFASGQEPTDMKRAHSGGGGMLGLNYYKASFHNYVIFTPNKDDLEGAGIDSKGIFSFLDSRSSASKARAEEKAKLKRWVLQRCKETGIPIDETLSNDGFVDAPNDCMLFDFSEIWRCKKNFAMNLPPLNYDVETQGPWEGRKLIAPIALVGDAVTEPFWLAGVGLQRGWNSSMDVCYVVDNLYNLTFSGESDPIPPTTWEDHMDRLQSILPQLYQYSHDGLMTKEGLRGEYEDSGVVMTQLTAKFRDAVKPQWQLEIDPFTRYEAMARIRNEKWKGAKANENAHPVAVRTVKLRALDDKAFAAKKLVAVDGKTIGAKQQEHAGQQQKKSTKMSESAASAPLEPTRIPESEVLKAATTKTESLHSMLAQQMELHIKKNASSFTASSSKAFSDEFWKEIPQEEGMGFAKITEQQWDVMTENHLSPSQRAELLHVRNMMASLKSQIETLNSSYQAFARAERELLMNRR